MGFLKKIAPILGFLFALPTFVRALAPSDTFQDADVGQSGYVGGNHGVDPDSVSQFKELWNATFQPDEKVCTHQNGLRARLTDSSISTTHDL